MTAARRLRRSACLIAPAFAQLSRLLLRRLLRRTTEPGVVLEERSGATAGKLVSGCRGVKGCWDAGRATLAAGGRARIIAVGGHGGDKHLGGCGARAGEERGAVAGEGGLMVAPVQGGGTVAGDGRGLMVAPAQGGGGEDS